MGSQSEERWCNGWAERGRMRQQGGLPGLPSPQAFLGSASPSASVIILEHGREGFRWWQASIAELSFNFLFLTITLGDDSMSSNVMWGGYFKEEFYLHYLGRERAPFSENVECINWDWNSILETEVNIQCGEESFLAGQQWVGCRCDKKWSP